MRRAPHIAVCILASSTLVFARADVPSTNLPPMLGSAASAAIGTVLARSDVALCRSIINPGHLRGDVGESLMGRVYLESMTSGDRAWQLISPRLGRQGIDGIFMKFDAQGVPKSMMVAEAKYGSSRLGITQDGMQLSPRWNMARLRGLSTRYLEVAGKRNITVSTIPSRGPPPRHRIDVQLQNGVKVSFWRENALETWKFDGPQSSLQDGQRRALTIGTYLRSAGHGQIDFRARLFRFKVDGDVLKVAVGDATHMPSSGKVPLTDFYDISLSGLRRPSYVAQVQSEIVSQLRKKLPHISEGEAASYARKITADAETMQQMIEASHRSLARSIATSTAKAAGLGAVVAGGIELVVEYALSGDIDPQRVGKVTTLGGVSSGVGALGGQGTVLLLTQSQLGHNTMLSLASSMNLPTASTAANVVGLGFGGALASVVFAYGGVALRLYDIDEANRVATAGVLASGAGAAAYGGTIGLAVTFGTASSGTAISSLSGVAAQNAAMAWLGGGSAAAGGGGMATGAIVVGGVVVVTVVAVTGGVMYGFYLYDQHQEDVRQQCMLRTLLTDPSVLDRVCGSQHLRFAGGSY